MNGTRWNLAPAGWTNSHLYQFVVGRGDYYIGAPSEDDFYEVEDSRKMKIITLLNAPKDKTMTKF